MMVKEEYEEVYERNFEARVRYTGTSLIITVPMRVRREIGLKPGDRVIINVRKEKEAILKKALATSARGEAS